MTEYFEVLSRDGPARLGELRLEDEVKTPALVGDILKDEGSIWSKPRKENIEGNKSKITVLPHRVFPPGTPLEVIKSKNKNPSKKNFPSASVQNSEKPRSLGHDVYILTGFRERAREVVDRIIKARQKLEPDSAIMAPSIATPSNLAILVYLGIDCFDKNKVIIEGRGGTYMDSTGEYKIEDLNELFCSCEFCIDSTPETISKKEISKHNLLSLKSELSRIRDKIKKGKIREYIEGQTRQNRWQVEAMRIFDDTEYSQKRAPIARKSMMDTNSQESMDRAEIKRFTNRVINRYSAPRSDVAVLLPCSAKKPYSKSQSHKKFRKSIRGRAHEIIITSPIGVVPRELELTYPAGHYDTPVTGRWTETEKAFVSNLLSKYLEENNYDRIISHVPKEGYKEVVEKTKENNSLEIENTTEGDPRSKKSLEKLDNALGNSTQANYSIQDKWFIRGIADYQFGKNIFDENLSLENIKVKGRFPQLRLHKSGSNNLLATLTPEYGILSLTIEGGKVFQAPKVEIDDFYPKGSVLAPGIKDAEPSILVGDEVLFEGPEAIGIGRSQMTGKEMIESTRGISIDVRHVQKNT